jgi:quercetin dioxygenase-like cupin family protein
MEPVEFASAETYEPEAGWRRVSLAGSDRFSFEWFEKPPGHSSPVHNHENEQVCLVVEGELTVYTGEENGETKSVSLGPFDSVWLGSWESHRVENTGSGTAVGIDVFAPGRSFDFWTDRADDDTNSGDSDDNSGSNGDRSADGGGHEDDGPE